MDKKRISVAVMTKHLIITWERYTYESSVDSATEIIETNVTPGSLWWATTGREVCRIYIFLDGYACRVAASIVNTI